MKRKKTAVETEIHGYAKMMENLKDQEVAIGMNGALGPQLKMKLRLIIKRFAAVVSPRQKNSCLLYREIL